MAGRGKRPGSRYSEEKKKIVRRPCLRLGRGGRGKAPQGSQGNFQCASGLNFLHCSGRQRDVAIKETKTFPFPLPLGGEDPDAGGRSPLKSCSLQLWQLRQRGESNLACILSTSVFVVSLGNLCLTLLSEYSAKFVSTIYRYVDP
jgi:hypothetical protein